MEVVRLPRKGFCRRVRPSSGRPCPGQLVSNPAQPPLDSRPPTNSLRQWRLCELVLDCLNSTASFAGLCGLCTGWHRGPCFGRCLWSAMTGKSSHICALPLQQPVCLAILLGLVRIHSHVPGLMLA